MKTSWVRNSITITTGGFNPSSSALTTQLTDSNLEIGQSKLEFLAQRFIQVSLDEKQQKINSTLEYVNKMLPELESKVYEVQDELVIFREKNTNLIKIVTKIIKILSKKLNLALK